jgi:predicted HicB family RNase H-like nuclease
MEDTKNLKISPELHKEIKIFCATKGLKMNEWVEKQLQEKINQIKDEMDNREITKRS